MFVSVALLTSLAPNSFWPQLYVLSGPLIMDQLMIRLTRDADNVWLLELAGAVTQEDLRQMLVIEINTILKILEAVQIQKLIIDLTAMQTFNSQGLQLLYLTHKQLSERDIQIILRNPSDRLREILRIMQLDQVFTFEFIENLGDS